MSCPKAAPTLARPDGAAIHALLESMRTALLGLPPGGDRSIPGEAGSAFAPTAEVTSLPAPDGVWVVMREADDARVLCIHNPASHPATVSLSTLLPGVADGPAYFLKGEMRTGDGADGMSVRLSPQGFVWLAFPRSSHR